MSSSTEYDARALLLHAAVVSDLLDGLLEAALADCRLTPREFEIATVLVTRGPLPPGEIGTITGVPAPSVSRLVAGMVRTGLVSHAAHPRDRRSRLVSLTSSGTTAYEEAQAAFSRLYDAVAGELGDSAPAVDGAVRRLEWALRSVAGMPIPEPLASDGPTLQSVSYPGPRLALDEEAEVVDYIAWLRHRRASGRRGRAEKAPHPSS